MDMNKKDQSFQAGMDAGRKTASIMRIVLINNARNPGETQEQYADRIITLVGLQLAQELRPGIRMKTQD